MKLRKIPQSLIALLAIVTSSSAATYTQDFNGFDDGATDVGDGSQMNGTANIQGGQLELTRDGVAGGFASFMIPALEGSENGWTASFDLTITDSVGANPPADGFSFNYGNFELTDLGGAEEGMGNAATENLSFEVDTWMNFDSEQGVNISQNAGGADQNLAFTNGPILSDGETVSGVATMSWDPVNGASFSTTGLETNAAFANVATTFGADDASLFGISARVGGANQTLLVDNLTITTVSEPNLVDSDGDGLEDGYEIANGLDPDDNGENPNNNGVAGDPGQGADGDPDLDTLTNLEEMGQGTNPQDDDTDADGYNDNVETNTGTWVSVADTGSDPVNDDSDGDDLLDGVENPDLSYDSANPTTQPGTDPNKADTDRDSVRDGAEVAKGRDPTVPQALPSGYLQDFDGFADGTTDLGDGSVMNGTAAVEGGQLVLTRDGVAGGFASFMIPALEGSENGWTASFDLTITDSVGANPPADGFSFNYGNFELTDLGGAEEGMGNAATENLSFEVDTWMNLDAEQGVNIAEKVAGNEIDLSFTNGSILADGTSVSGPVTIVYDPEEGLSFTTEGLLTNADFENIATTFFGDAGYNFGLSARVGGANQTLAIDNLQISLGSAPQDNFRIISIENVIVPGGGGNPDTKSVTVTWNSSDRKIYEVFASSDLPAGDDEWDELDDSVSGAAGAETTSFTESGIPAGTVRRFYQIREVAN
jgi:hypothetical protein